MRDAESSDEHTPLGSGISAHEPAESFILPGLPQRGSDERNGEMNPGSQVLFFIIVSFSGSVKVGGPQRCGWKKASEQNRMTT